MDDVAWPALADPTRRALLGLLCQRPHAVGELVAALGLPQPAVSKHLRVLRSAGLVFVTGDAQRRIYSIDPRPFHSLDAWLEPYRRLWNTHLDRLGEHLDAFSLSDTAGSDALASTDALPRPEAPSRSPAPTAPDASPDEADTPEERP